MEQFGQAEGYSPFLLVTQQVRDPPERWPFLHSLPSGHSRLLPSNALCVYQLKGNFKSVGSQKDRP